MIASSSFPASVRSGPGSPSTPASRRAPAAIAIGMAVFVAAAGFALAQAPAGDPVIAKVNGIEIRQSDLAIAEEDIGSNLPQQAAPEQKRDYLITYLADMLLVDSLEQCKKLGELQHAPSEWPRAVPCLQGRAGAELSVADFTGLGVEDLFIAELIYET